MDVYVLSWWQVSVCVCVYPRAFSWCLKVWCFPLFLSSCSRIHPLPKLLPNKYTHCCLPIMSMLCSTKSPSEYPHAHFKLFGVTLTSLVPDDSAASSSSPSPCSTRMCMGNLSLITPSSSSSSLSQLCNHSESSEAALTGETEAEAEAAHGLAAPVHPQAYFSDVLFLQGSAIGTRDRKKGMYACILRGREWNAHLYSCMHLSNTILKHNAGSTYDSKLCIVHVVFLHVCVSKNHIALRVPKIRCMHTYTHIRTYIHANIHTLCTLATIIQICPSLTLHLE